MDLILDFTIIFGTLMERCVYGWMQVAHRWCFSSAVNDTTIALIPKVDYPQGMKDYRPISLCNVAYKILSKVLANRLKKVLENCVSKEQLTFVRGRSIIGNALVAYENFHFMKSKIRVNKRDVALKIDISKAYDRID